MDINSPSQFNRLKKKTGFTIIEALTAIIILGICAVALFASLQLGFNLVNDIRENIIASSRIQEEMEELRKTFFSTLPSYGETSFGDPTDPQDSLSLLYNSSGTIKVDQYIDVDIVRVVITVSWYSRLNINKQNTKRMITLITRNGINSI